ncbi:hypothetical protein BJ912DRAFT_928481 [Pholiota molesta]|nr:hypothetical protein BJ912DRAFT_928481 [Pholiota molesta]
MTLSSHPISHFQSISHRTGTWKKPRNTPLLVPSRVLLGALAAKMLRGNAWKKQSSAVSLWFYDTEVGLTRVRFVGFGASIKEFGDFATLNGRKTQPLSQVTLERWKQDVVGSLLRRVNGLVTLYLISATAMQWDVRDDGNQDAISSISELAERVRCALLNSVWETKECEIWSGQLGADKDIHTEHDLLLPPHIAFPKKPRNTLILVPSRVLLGALAAKMLRGNAWKKQSSAVSLWFYDTEVGLTRVRFVGNMNFTLNNE